MIVKELMKKLTCDHPKMPVNLYGCRTGKTHAEFEYQDFKKGAVGAGYLSEEVESYQQHETHGVISIMVKI